MCLAQRAEGFNAPLGDEVWARQATGGRGLGGSRAQVHAEGFWRIGLLLAVELPYGGSLAAADFGPSLVDFACQWNSLAHLDCVLS